MAIGCRLSTDKRHATPGVSFFVGARVGIVPTSAVATAGVDSTGPSFLDMPHFVPVWVGMMSSSVWSMTAAKPRESHQKRASVFGELTARSRTTTRLPERRLMSRRRDQQRIEFRAVRTINLLSASMPFDHSHPCSIDMSEYHRHGAIVITPVKLIFHEAAQSGRLRPVKSYFGD